MYELRTQLEGTPDGAFRCCDDRVASDLFHLVYRYSGIAYEGIIEHRVGEGYHLEDSDWFFGHLAQLVQHYMTEETADLPLRLHLVDMDQGNNKGKPWTVAQVSIWLARHDFGQHVARFAECAIDGPRLIDLDNTDLRSIGIRAIHDRQALLRAITTLRERLIGNSQRLSTTSTGSGLDQSTRRKTFLVKERHGVVKIVDADTNEEVHELAPLLLKEINKAISSTGSTVSNGGHHYHKHIHRVIEDESTDSEEEEGWHHDWYQVGRSRAAALALLQGKPDGYFIVRDASVGRGQALSFVYNGKICTEYILPNDEPYGFVLESAPTRVFRDLDHLVTHFSRAKRPELPVQLRGMSTSHGYPPTLTSRSSRPVMFDDEQLTLESQAMIAQSIRTGSLIQRGSQGYNLASDRSMVRPPRSIHSNNNRSSVRPTLLPLRPSGTQVVVAVPKGQPAPTKAVARMSAPRVQSRSQRRFPGEEDVYDEAGVDNAGGARNVAPQVSNRPIYDDVVDERRPSRGDRQEPALAAQQVPTSAIVSETDYDDDTIHSFNQYAKPHRPQSKKHQSVVPVTEPEIQPASNARTSGNTIAPPLPMRLSQQSLRPQQPLSTSTSEGVAQEDDNFEDGLPFERSGPKPSAAQEGGPALPDVRVPRVTSGAMTGDDTEDWFKMDIGRQEAKEELDGLTDGEFLVHHSDKALAELTMRYKENFMSRHIMRKPDRGYFIEGTGRYFPTIPLLVQFYQSDDQSDLPIPLAQMRVSQI